MKIMEPRSGMRFTDAEIMEAAKAAKARQELIEEGYQERVVTNG